MLRLCLISILLIPGCGDASGPQADATLPALNLEVPVDLPRSELVICSEYDAELTLFVTITALPDWPGKTFDFPLKRPTPEKPGWTAHGYVCSVGPNGFYGAVNVEDANSEIIPIDVHLTYDRAPHPDAKTLDAIIDAHLYEDGERAFDYNWHVKWHWHFAKDDGRNRVAAAISDRGPHTTWHAGPHQAVL